MQIPGKRLKGTRLIRTDQYVVAVDVEAVVPDEDPSEPCFEPETVHFLREIEDRAQKGDLEWLRQHGKVYQSVDAA